MEAGDLSGHPASRVPSVGRFVLQGRLPTAWPAFLAAAKAWSIQRCRLVDVVVVVTIQLMALAGMFAIRLPVVASR
jgi:hypothetical protein